LKKKRFFLFSRFAGLFVLSSLLVACDAESDNTMMPEEIVEEFSEEYGVDVGTKEQSEDTSSDLRDVTQKDLELIFAFFAKVQERDELKANVTASEESGDFLWSYVEGGLSLAAYDHVLPDTERENLVESVIGFQYDAKADPLWAVPELVEVSDVHSFVAGSLPVDWEGNVATGQVTSPTMVNLQASGLWTSSVVWEGIVIDFSEADKWNINYAIVRND